MTVTDTDPAVASNGAAEPEPSGDGLHLLPNGKVRFVIDGAPFTLRNPRIREFRRLHSLWLDGAGTPRPEQLDHQIGWVKLLFNGDPESDPPQKGLSDHPLPEDPDEWAAWVGAAQYQGKVMVHFRDVPLAPGGPAPTQ